jgi:hypothetical protein
MDTPERPDGMYMGKLLRELFSQRIAIIAMLIICLALIGVIIMLYNKPIPIAVVNGESGKTFFSKTQTIDRNILEKQILYYSRQFCEDYFGRNHVTVRTNRQRALDMMHPNMRTEVQKGIDAEINRVLTELWNDQFTWKVTVVTEKNDPRYSVFCQFELLLNRPGYESVTRSYNIKLDWGRLVKNSDPFERPHSLVLLKAQELDANSDELKKQLNLSF